MVRKPSGVLLQKFIEFNSAHRLASARKRTLLAVSGGLDSVVMVHLFKMAGFPFAIAHSNFQLRGHASDGDEEFVKHLANQLDVEFYSKRFETEQYVNENSVSVQLAARELRYKWFEELFDGAKKSDSEYANIATAHHLNDCIETVLLNLTRGTGIRGLRGIPERNGHIIRPLLFATRNELEEFARENKIEHREDSSNATDKYARNKIRHHVIPVLKELNPSLESTFASNLHHFTELEELYNHRQRKWSRNLFVVKGDEVFIPIAKLKVTPHASSVLYEHLKEYGFNPSQIEDIIAAVDAQPGTLFCSASHRIIRDRKFFIVSPVTTHTSTIVVVEAETESVSVSNHSFSISRWNVADVKIKPVKKVAYLDADLVTFPLVIREWRAGDYFYPFGMNMKKKKLKKFFTDEKIPLHEKEKILVIENNSKVLWVCGYRIDERFRVTDKTKSVLKIEFF